MNPNKIHVLSCKGNKKELVMCCKNLLEMLEKDVQTDEHTIKGVMYKWKADEAGQIYADLKVL